MQLRNRWKVTDVGGFQPLHVRVVDLDKEVPALGRSERVRVLARIGGMPLGSVDIEAPVGGLDGAKVKEILRNRVRPGPSQPLREVPKDELPYISVVVPTTFSRSFMLRRCVDSLLALDYPNYEVLIVDNRPDRDNASSERRALVADNTQWVSTGCTRCEVITESRPGISAARARGVEAARGDIVAFTDDDAVADGGWLLGIGKRFVCNPHLTCVSGLVMPAELVTEAQMLFDQSGSGPAFGCERYEVARVGRSREGARPAAEEFRVLKLGDARSEEFWLYEVGDYGMGNNFAVRREYLMGGVRFPLYLGAGTRCQGGEDAVAFMQLMWDNQVIGYEPSAIVMHYNRDSMEALRRQMFGYGLGFVAALCEMIRRDRRHLSGLSRIVVPAVVALTGRDKESRHGQRPERFPRSLVALELLGMVLGPMVYLTALVEERASRLMRAKRYDIGER